MYLYDKKENTIDVYEMTPNFKKTVEYKKNEMETIPFDERVLKACSNCNRELEHTDSPIIYEKLQYRENRIPGRVYYHSITSYQMTDEEKIRQSELLGEYYNGDYKNKKIALIKKSKNEITKYFLLTALWYSCCDNEYVMDDIISIPKSLYLLQMLEQGKFYRVDEEDISKQLQTFNISTSPVERISIAELKNMYNVGLLHGTFDCIMDKVETTQKILQKVKK